MSGDPYIKENDELRAEIADLQSANKLLHNLIANREAEIARLEAQLELAQTFGSKRERALQAALLPYAERVIESEDGGATARNALATEGK